MKKEKNYFPNIIGYHDVKITLERIIDILNNPDKYKKLGSTVPHGLLLYGSPGVGKTSFLKSFMNSTQRKCFIVRKNMADGSFIEYLNHIFEDAKKSQPSLILLDDLDKYSEDDDCSNQEEFVAVQSFIDDIKDLDIFVLATANNKNLLPRSLVRSGRFDIQIKIEKTNEKDAIKIFQFYLKNKKVSSLVNIKNISYILDGASCADLEKVCNQASVYAGFQNKEEIEMNDLVRASLEWVYDTNMEDCFQDDEYDLNVAYHEAGHAIVGELLESGSISFATIMKNTGDTRGVTIFHNNEHYFDNILFMQNRIKSLLAGKAATEIVYHTVDVGANSDLHRAFDIANRLVDNYCSFGFDAWYSNPDVTSEKVKMKRDELTSKILQDYYIEVKQLLISNRDLLDYFAKELSSKKILFQDDIVSIYQKFRG